MQSHRSSLIKLAASTAAITVAAAVVAETRSRQAEADAPSGIARGRDATRPSEIPTRGWKDVLVRVYQGIGDDRILANAAGVTFYGLLALFPGIAALVSIYALFADPQTVAQHLDAARGILPEGGVEVIRDQLNRIAGQGPAKLGLGFAVSVCVALWSANGGIKALFDALNTVYEETEARSFLRLNAISLMFTAAMIGFLIVGLTCIAAVPFVLDELPGFMVTVLDYLRWPSLLVIAAVAFASIYRHGPSRTKPQWRWISWGGAAAAVTWLGASALFSWYAADFGSFNKTYGALGAIIGFMTWMWISVIVVLLGGKLNAEMEHQTAKDSTVGESKPLGTRGARMADTVGPSA
jgi:membrane protein